MRHPAAGPGAAPWALQRRRHVVPRPHPPKPKEQDRVPQAAETETVFPSTARGIAKYREKAAHTQAFLPQVTLPSFRQSGHPKEAASSRHGRAQREQRGRATPGKAEARHCPGHLGFLSQTRPATLTTTVTTELCTVTTRVKGEMEFTHPEAGFQKPRTHATQEGHMQMS